MSIYDVIPVTFEDYRRRARFKLPRFLFDYIDGAANSEFTAAANVSDFERIRLKQRVMRDVSGVDTATRFLGERVAMPLALAPVGMAGMFARRGEAQAARAATSVGVPFTTSTLGICSVEEVSEAAGGSFWFQLYMLRDRDVVVEMLRRAWNAGARTLAFTVDLAVPGLRQRDFRNGMVGGALPGKLSQAAALATSPFWLWDVGINGKPHNFGNLTGQVDDPDRLDAYRAFVESQIDPGVTWEDIRWLREQWQGKLLIKGVLEPEDALAAADCGADGVIVSNHGGRQLDGVASTISKLPAVAKALEGRCEIYLDSGVRTGLDVVRAVALGANGVLIGRAWVYAMAAAGERGVADLLRVFQREIHIAMALMGVNRIEEITADAVERPT
jgi:L-lactate dehydrogenase (cytochrome)